MSRRTKDSPLVELSAIYSIYSVCEKKDYTLLTVKKAIMKAWVIKTVNILMLPEQLINISFARQWFNSFVYHDH